MVTGTKVNLRNQFYQQISQRIQMRMQETARFQSMARANMQSLQMNQQRLAQTLAQNSQAMSNMIMDSWNQKQASDARISQARSEAIFRGDLGRQQLSDYLWAECRCERDGGSRLPGPVRRCLWRLRYSAGSGVLEPE